MDDDLELEQMRMAEEAGKSGSFLWDLDSDELTWSVGLYHLLHVELDTPVTLETYLALIPKVERALLTAQTREALEAGPFQLEHPIRAGDTTLRVRLQAKPVTVDGRACVIGAVVDISAQMRNRDRMTALVRQLEQSLANSENLIAILRHAENFPPRSVAGTEE